MNPPKAERNKQLVKLRDKDPKKYSFGELGKIFNISKVWAFHIYKREKKKKIVKV